ncbi:Lrp/AsnC family transcriptional regulator [Aeromicrobium sp. CnD17-E]|uniref:Lrp/AsnC family transcriptional regulator n=1 Tax=Aeromicrobium sp. CnD17-E TaxID=2954487 RepID=UPI002097404B|nr:Lrp/AsnC family transcriptional regulator [Aeromicrobium sp. CnD17-E]MCO7237662.1 Lrp/AsnC family transcriptional regulator [Aeromicrobium sp. CnD17-E]
MLDDVDHRLLSLLRADARTPVAELARQVAVNRSTVAARIERMVTDGVIEGFTVTVGNDVDRDAIRGVSMVSIAPNRGKDVVRAVRGFPEVEQLHSTIGEWDLVVHLRSTSLSEFDTVLERIRAVAGVTDTRTSLLFNSLTNH